MNNDDFDSFERAGWVGRAAAYQRGFARITAHTIPFLLDAAKVTADTHVLDVGCGPGIVTSAAVDRAADVVAVDADPEMAALAGAENPSVPVHVAVLPTLPFADNTFDAVVGNFVINHTGDPAATLTTLRRVLKPGAHLALTCWTYPAMRANGVFTEAVEAAGVHHPDDVPAGSPMSQHAQQAPFGELLTSAGYRDVRVDVLSWIHRVDPHAWWTDILAGTCVNAAVITRQDELTQARIKREYLRIVKEYATPEGQVALPAVALLASGVAPTGDGG
ncbi:class I SAM-dependent methyltransferase [Actinocrispum wychmicini]|uniref:Methyltransferase family protein n=1 Tax=Actinocrispum wychmicini TaxID=1213861 RepID=A0A4R2J6X1_9PSEU|nr:class I SAM-dependent methyltransferase [Actinocrispum wychmicini]TCO54244.1 methyltransferase family protein [Actinocrispum wychmicini]